MARLWSTTSPTAAGILLPIPNKSKSNSLTVVSEKGCKAIHGSRRPWGINPGIHMGTYSDVCNALVGSLPPRKACLLVLPAAHQLSLTMKLPHTSSELVQGLGTAVCKDFALKCAAPTTRSSSSHVISIGKVFVLGQNKRTTNSHQLEPFGTSTCRVDCEGGAINKS